MAFNETLRLILDVDAARGKRELDDFTRKASSNLQRVGATMTQVGGTLTRQVTLPLVALGGVATKMAADFDGAFVQMQTLAGVTAGEVDHLKESVLGLAGETGRSPQELAEALFFLSSSGLDSAQAMEALEASAKASAIGMGSTIQIADAVSSAMNAYATSNLSAAEALDVLVATAQQGKAEPAELAAQMGRVLPIAAELEVSFQDVGAAIAALSLGGNDAATATTQLTNVLAKLLRPSQQAQEALDEVGLSVEDVQAMLAEEGLLGTLTTLKDLLGDSGFVNFLEDTQAIQGALGLVGENAEKVEEIFGNLHDSTGALDNAFSRWAESMGAKNARAFGEMQAAMVTFGEAIAPIVSNILGFVGDLAEVFADLPEPLQNVIAGILTFAAALGPIMSVAGNVTSFIGGLTKLTGSLGTAIGSTSLAVGALVAGLTIAAMTVFAFKQRQADAERQATEFADALRRGGDEAQVMADEIIHDELAAGELGSQMREAGTDISVFADEIRNGGDAAIELAESLAATSDPRTSFRDGLAEAADAGSALADELLALVEAEDLNWQQTLELLQKIGELGDRYAEGAEQAENTAFSEEQLAGAAEEAGLAFDEQGNLVEDATSALQDYADQLAATFDPIFGMLDALQSSQEAQVNLRMRQEELNAAIAEFGPNSAEATEAQQALTDAHVQARESVIDLQSAAIALQDAIVNNGLSVTAARDQFISMATQMGFTRGEAETLASQFGLTADEADRLAGNYPVTVSAPGATGARLDIDAVRAAANSLDGRRVSVTVFANTVFAREVGSFGRARQFGGGIEPGDIYRVGEVAPEWFVSDRAGRILTESQMRNLAGSRSVAPMGSMSGTAVVENHFHFHGPVASQPDAERWVATAWNRAYDRNLINARGRRL